MQDSLGILRFMKTFNSFSGYSFTQSFILPFVRCLKAAGTMFYKQDSLQFIV